MAFKASNRKKSLIPMIINTTFWSTVLVAFGIFVVLQNMSRNAAPVDMTAASVSEIAEGNTYYLGEATFIDTYAEWDDDDGNAEGLYCLVEFTDGENTSYLTSVSVYYESDLWDTLTDYLTDDSQEIGSLTVPVYCYSEEMDDELTEWFQEVADDYSDLYPLSRIAMDMSYQGQNEADAEENNGALFPAWGGFVMIALGIVGFCTIPIFVRQQKKINEEAAAVSTEAASAPVQPASHFDTSKDKDPWD